MEPGLIIGSYTTKSGKQCVVRTLKNSDVDDLLRYANALIDEDTYVLLSGKHLTHAYEKRYVADAIKKMKKDEKVHLLAQVNDVIACSCEIRRYSLRKSHVGEIGISVSREFRGDGIAKICMRTLMEVAKKIGLRMLVLTCFAQNTAAISLYTSFGFKKGGRIPGMFYYKNSYHDELFMYCTVGKE